MGDMLFKAVYNPIHPNLLFSTCFAETAIIVQVLRTKHVRVGYWIPRPGCDQRSTVCLLDTIGQVVQKPKGEDKTRHVKRNTFF